MTLFYQYIRWLFAAHHSGDNSIFLMDFEWSRVRAHTPHLRVPVRNSTFVRRARSSLKLILEFQFASYLAGWYRTTQRHIMRRQTLCLSLQTTASSSFTSSYSTWTAFFSMIFCCCCCQFRFGVWSKAIDPSWWIEMLLFCGGWFSRLTSSAEKFKNAISLIRNEYENCGRKLENLCVRDDGWQGFMAAELYRNYSNICTAVRTRVDW